MWHRDIQITYFKSILSNIYPDAFKLKVLNRIFHESERLIDYLWKNNVDSIETEWEKNMVCEYLSCEILTTNFDIVTIHRNNMRERKI